jgi:SAM-dependent methyltransferase/DNA-binding transcriptional ArsR family regulator
MCLCVGDLGRDLGIAPSTVSHHVKELHHAGLIRTERKGQTILCYVDPGVREEIARFFGPPQGAIPGRTTMNRTDVKSGVNTGVPEGIDEDRLRDSVRDAYARVARAESAGCCGAGAETASPCCGPGASAGEPGGSVSTEWGYSADELARVPEGADLGLGCGNPTAIASLAPGETVLDLGSGGGLDCFLAADRVGPGGRVIGVDMTPDMITRARENARKSGATNVEFRLGEIENIPAADDSVDVLLSNCVINLSPDKPRVFREAFRVLRPGGRIAFSDIVATGPVPEAAKRDLALWAGCASGALPIAELERLLGDTGFEEVRITVQRAGHEVVTALDDASELGKLLASATIEGRKPRR